MATGSSDLHLVVILVLVLLVVPSMNRTCGGCTLRCKLLPVRELKKLANTRCQHQRAAAEEEARRRWQQDQVTYTWSSYSYWYSWWYHP